MKWDKGIMFMNFITLGIYQAYKKKNETKLKFDLNKTRHKKM